MKDLNFKTLWNSSPDRGEDNSHELITEPGQAFTTREIYTRFLTTGRVMSEARVVFDSDELGREPDFNDFDPTQKGDFDLADVSNHNMELAIAQRQKESINALSASYALGKISFDDFCYQSRLINADYAKPFIDKFGSALAKNTSSQGTKTQDE